jgi:DNA-binding HxlR family transcriptional regulator
VPTSKAAERRVRDRSAYLTSMAVCPTHRVLNRMGERWVSLVFKELSGRPRRYGDLARAVAGASQKMLTQTLRVLERDGLVSRSVTESVPPAVEYRLTALGESLLPVMAAVTGWAERHIGDIDAARAAYDAARSAGRPGARGQP